MAIGDAFGMKYEFVPHEQNKTEADLHHGPHPKYTAYKQGHYTDDTQMSLANAELLMRNRAPGSGDFIDTWLEAFRRDPREGYSKYMWQVMSGSATAAAFTAAVDPKRGTTSGGAMRAGPFGLLDDVEEVKALTTLQARITHDTPAGVSSALAVALSVHFLHHGGTRTRLPGFLEKHIGDKWAENGYADDPHNSLKIVSQALKAVQNAPTLSRVLLNAVNQDPVSDTDTICALAMLVASRCPEIKNDLPPALHDGLDKGPFGADYLKEADKRLNAAFPARKLYAARAPGPKRTP